MEQVIVKVTAGVPAELILISEPKKVRRDFHGILVALSFSLLPVFSLLDTCQNKSLNTLNITSEVYSVFNI